MKRAISFGLLLLLPAPSSAADEVWPGNEWATAALASSAQQPSKPRATPARGPLRKHPDNARYFTDGTGKAVYLTGAHTWNNLQDMGPADPPPAFDFDAHLSFLGRHGHNFVRLWTWELVSWDTRPNGQAAMHTVAPHAWARAGPGNALDGKPRFDLEKFDATYFERLRSRVRAAGERGIYVSVMLFEGWGLQHMADAWKAHPFHPDNNVNGIDGDADRDGRGLELHTMKVPAVTAAQERYVRKVIDTVNDLDNVLYEIANEAGAYSTEWQYHMIRLIQDTEKRKPRQHPVGMTFQYARDKAWRGSNNALMESPADWVSPNPEAGGGYDYRTNPPAADGAKVILSDTDHLWGIGGNPQWVWKSLCRGLNPIFMDPYDNSVLGKGQATQWEGVRRSLGHARRLAERTELAAMTPRDDLASTKYCLARPGVAYVTYLPDGGEVTLDVSAAAGPLEGEWIHPVEGTVTRADPVTGGARRTLKTPFAGGAVLYLWRK